MSEVGFDFVGQRNRSTIDRVTICRELLENRFKFPGHSDNR